MIIISIENFINAVTLHHLTLLSAITNPTIYTLFLPALVFIASAYLRSEASRIVQVIFIGAFGFGYLTVTEQGNLTGVLFLVYSLTLAIQYGYLQKYLAVKTAVIISVYLVATTFMVFFVKHSNIFELFGNVVATALFLYLFYIAFAEEIRDYIRQNRELSAELEKVRDEKARVEATLREREATIARQKQMLQQEAAEKDSLSQELQQSLEERVALLQEVHHRVKNNLTVMNSLLSLQVGRTQQKEAHELLRASQTRIFSMALVHEDMYKMKSFAHLDLGAYIESLVDGMKQSYRYHHYCSVSVDAAGVFLPIQYAIPCGIVLSECLSNAMRHAFPSALERMNQGVSEVGDRLIRVYARATSDEVTLRVSDNGVGISQEAAHDKPGSMGIWLMRSLVRDQLHGTLTIGRVEQGSGTEASIVFRPEMIPAPAG